MRHNLGSDDDRVIDFIERHAQIGEGEFEIGQAALRGAHAARDLDHVPMLDVMVARLAVTRRSTELLRQAAEVVEFVSTEPSQV